METFRDIALRIAKDKYSRAPSDDADILLNVLSEALDEYLDKKLQNNICSQ